MVACPQKFYYHHPPLLYAQNIDNLGKLYLVNIPFHFSTLNHYLPQPGSWWHPEKYLVNSKNLSCLRQGDWAGAFALFWFLTPNAHNHFLILPGACAHFLVFGSHRTAFFNFGLGGFCVFCRASCLQHFSLSAFSGWRPPRPTYNTKLKEIVMPGSGTGTYILLRYFRWTICSK